MVNGKKVIGVCITKMHDISRTRYLERMYQSAKSKGYVFYVFNSFDDFYAPSSFAEGAKNIYRMVNYDIMDVLVVFSEAFMSKDVVAGIVARAKAKNVPVIMIKDQAEDCHCITGNPTKEYKALLRQLFTDNSITDPFFIGGWAEDENTKLRFSCYQEVLEEFQITFNANDVAYGSYYDEPTIKIIRKLATTREKMPDAFVCANDSMALAACQELQRLGYRVPEDVCITGFDGIPAAFLSNPSISTCKEDYGLIADCTFKLIEQILAGNYELQHIHYSYEVCPGESTSYIQDKSNFEREMLFQLYELHMESRSHEEVIFNWIDNILEIKDLDALYRTLYGLMLPESYLSINTSFINFLKSLINEGEETPTDTTLQVLSSAWNHINPSRCFQMEMQELMSGTTHTDDSAVVLIPIYVGSMNIGVYAISETSFTEHAYKIKRVAKIIDLAFNEVHNRFSRDVMEKSIANAAFHNPVSKLPNLRGVNRWYKEFMEIEDNHKKILMVSIYCLPKYNFIMEHYGIQDAEDAVSFTADTLLLANSTKSYVGHIADDEFIVINYVDDATEISGVIDQATTTFFHAVESYNQNNDKNYYIEINCGCTIVEPYSQVNIENYITLARSEMYINRMNMSSTPTIKRLEQPKESYIKFSALIEKNLFHYAFQPIIDVHTGEIYAYEALMRTDDSIGLNPGQILQIATEYDRLYDIEKATMFNVLEHIKTNSSIFNGKKVFINSIPGCFLNETDVKRFSEQYGAHIENCVIEITEQNTVSDTELNQLKQLGQGTQNVEIAIDDYGTGHSNIVNLLRYHPHIIKIDRYLIEHIDLDENKKLFVKSTIEFARANNIKVLAEGVETAEELETVIRCGVDFVQGFYTGRPVFEPIAHIEESLQKTIKELIAK